MDKQSPITSTEEGVVELQACAKALVEKLSADSLENFQEASAMIVDMIEARDRTLFNKVGRLTRGLHDAIVNFHIDGHIDEEAEGIHDATDRLNYVINLTQQAADRTMDMVEASAPIAMNLGQEANSLRDDWLRLRRREMSKDEFSDLYKRMDIFLNQMCEGTEALNANMQTIVLEQGFQDLTGQVIKKVIGLVKDVEADLVDLVRIAGQVEEMTGVERSADDSERKSEELEGPQIHADKRDDVVSGQDDVDDLLSSLGF